MDKKLLKVIIDIVKNVDAATRPGLAGAVTYSHDKEGEKSYLYASDGYRAIKIECGGPAMFLPINDDIFWPLDAMQKEYKTLKASELATLQGAEKLPEQKESYSVTTPPDYRQLWRSFDGLEGDNSAELDVELLKAIAPLGRGKVEILKASAHAHILRFTAPGLEYVQMGLSER